MCVHNAFVCVVMCMCVFVCVYMLACLWVRIAISCVCVSVSVACAKRVFFHKLLCVSACCESIPYMLVCVGGEGEYERIHARTSACVSCRGACSPAHQCPSGLTQFIWRWMDSCSRYLTQFAGKRATRVRLLTQARFLVTIVNSNHVNNGSQLHHLLVMTNGSFFSWFLFL